MGFHDILFPKLLSYGTRGGAGYKTMVVESDSGPTVRATSWRPGSSRVLMDVAKTVQSRDDLSLLIDFYRTVHGSAYGFRFLDALDWSTNRQKHIGLPRFHPDDRFPTNPPTGDGSNKLFRLEKHYPDDWGGVFRRRITRPTRPTDDAQNRYLAVFANGVPIYFNGTNFGFQTAVEYDTGKLIIDPAPGNGVSIEAAFAFHVPARFGLEVDRRLDAAWREGDNFELGSIPIVEITEDRHTGAEKLLYGGHDDIDLAANPFVLPMFHAQYMRLTNGFSGQAVVMPDPTVFYATAATTPTGHLGFVLENATSFTITVTQPSGFFTIMTLPPNWTTELYWMGGTRQWVER